MKKERLTLLMALLLSFGLLPLFAQVATPVSGSTINDSLGTVSYSVGQVFFSTYTDSTGTIIQGVQQPYDISVISGIKQAKSISLTCMAYPNPMTDYLILSLDAEHNGSMRSISYQLYDLSGNLLDRKPIDSDQTKISMYNMELGTYILKITQVTSSSTQEIKTFKIIKAQ